MNAVLKAVVIGLLGFAVIAGVLFGYPQWRQWQAKALSKQQSDQASVDAARRRDERLETVNRIRVADDVADPLKRCLDFPDPPAIHWNKDVVAEVCRIDTLKIVGIDEISDLLSKKDAKAVDRIFDDYAQRDANDPASKGILAHAFENLFETDNAKVGRVVDQWVKDEPTSYNALAARGIFRLRSAYEARGTASSGETPDANFEAMHRLLALGENDIEASAKLNPKFLPPALYRLSVKRAHGNQQEVADAGRRAVELAPTELNVYLFWLNAASPLWGGTIGTLHEITKVAETSKASPSVQALVNARAKLFELKATRPQMSQADYDTVFAIAPDRWALREAGRVVPGEAVVVYASQSIRFYPSVSSYMARSEVLDYRNQKEWSRQDAERAVRLGEFGADASVDFASALRTTGHPDEAATAFEAIVSGNPHDKTALRSLAQIYQGELHDQPRALKAAEALVASYPDDEASWGTLAYVTKESDVPKYCDAMARSYGRDTPVARWDTDNQCGSILSKDAGGSTESVKPR